jgi:hypothetical protein
LNYYSASVIREIWPRKMSWAGQIVHFLCLMSQTLRSTKASPRPSKSTAPLPLDLCSSTIALSINTLKPSGDYIYHLLYQSVTLHFVNRDHFLKQR